MDRLRALVYGSALLLIVGWVLYIGQAIFIPAVLGAVIVYVIVGLAHAFDRLPVLGRRLPLQLRYLFSIAVIGLVFFLLVYLVMANRERAIELAPQYQQSLLAAIQRAAVYLGVETEPSWNTLRQDLLAQVNLQRLVGSLLASLGSIVVTFVVVFLYAAFLLLERRFFETKLANLSDDPARVARIRQVIEAINRRIGSYLALKTLLSLLLGLASYGVMRLFGLEFAALWAVLAAFLNFIPYVGSVLGVLLPGLMAVVQFEDIGLILTLLLALTSVQFVIGNFLDPYLMGNSLNLSPFAILVSLALWSELWGVPGAFLAVPITAIAAIVFSAFPGTRPIAVLLSNNGRI
ncbi:MAG: AI-2E family transporter [Burkholderiales bacterium]|jgi:predicted PurR-regulated permease PerM|nr:AI-2E family transporter [Burkholderiales bacterium]